MKKFISVLTAVLIAALSFTICASARSYGKYQNGDVNRDNGLSIKDATHIQEYLAKLRNYDNIQMKLADVDLDGSVSIKDTTYIQKVLAKLAVMPEEATVETEPVHTAPVTEPSKATEPVTTVPVTTVPQPTDPAVEPEGDVDTNIKISFRNSLKWSKVYFYFYSSDGKSQVKDYPGVAPEKSGTSAGDDIYTYTIDVSKFDRVVFNNNSEKSMDVSLSLASTGFYPKSKGTDGKYIVEKYRAGTFKRGKLTKTTLTYSTGYEKKIWIYTPANYSAEASFDYPTIYMCDGQNLFSDHTDGYGGWDVEGAVDGLLANTGRGFIAVGIDNGNSKRDSELTPNLGAINSELPANERSHYSNGTGKAFSDFVVNKVMPYVRENYKSSAKREDNIICGSSSGGLEAFYIGMEHKDKFSTIGALSPAFLLFGDATWNTYLGKFDLSGEDIPKLYLYCGNSSKDSLEQNLFTYTDEMYKRLKKLGFPEDKIRYSIFEPGVHNESWWKMYFPEVFTLHFS